MTRLSLTREIYCPADEVFAFHTDLERAPQHWVNVISCVRCDGRGEPPAPGARYAWRYRMYGVEFSGFATVRDVVEGRRFTFDAEGGLHGTVTCDYLAISAARTRVHVDVEYEVPMGLVGRAVDRLLVESRNAADGERAMDRLAERMEAEVAARLDMQPA